MMVCKRSSRSSNNREDLPGNVLHLSNQVAAQIERKDGRGV